ncbi:MAG: hypothetical protein ACLUNZ_01725 [Evtepia sp.]
MEHNFQPLLFGGDINVYSVARAFHEAYGIQSVCYGKFASGPAYGSTIIDYRVCPQNEDAATFRENVAKAAQEFADKTVLVIGCGDSYVKLAAENKQSFPENCIAAYTVSGELINTLINKEKFYALCDEYGIDHPGTFIYRKEMGHDFELNFQPPYICKPANGVAYWEHPFEGNEKVFTCPDRKNLEEVLDKVYASGYPDTMIIQELHPRRRQLHARADQLLRPQRQSKAHVSWAMCSWRNTPPTASATTPSSSTSRAAPSRRRSRRFWRTSAMSASPTSTSSMTSGTASTRSLRSTAARGAATTTSPARATTSPSSWWRTG